MIPNWRLEPTVLIVRGPRTTSEAKRTVKLRANTCAESRVPPRTSTAGASPQEEAEEEAEASVFPSRPERGAAETPGLSLVRGICRPSSCRVVVVRGAGQEFPPWLHASS